MSSIKSMVGHSLGAMSAMVVACVLALKHQVVPPTANYETPDPECDLDYVPRTARPRKLSNVLSRGQRIRQIAFRGAPDRAGWEGDR